MKKNVTYNRTVQYLNKVFKGINEKYFGGEIAMPTITIQSTTGAYGHVSVSKVWKDSEGKATHELNLSADYLNRDITEVVATMIHEAVHLWNLQNSIKDCSGYYHNRKFKELAEQCGLQIDKHPKYGWTITTPTEETIDFCIEYGFTDIEIARNSFEGFVPTGGTKAGDPSKPAKPPVKKGNSIKWVCPCCGTIIRSTKEVNVICGDCGEKFVKA